MRVLQEVLLEGSTQNSSSAPFVDLDRPATRARVRSSRSDPKLQENPDHHVSTNVTVAVIVNAGFCSCLLLIITNILV